MVASLRRFRAPHSEQRILPVGVSTELFRSSLDHKGGSSAGISQHERKRQSATGEALVETVAAELEAVPPRGEGPEDCLFDCVGAGNGSHQADAAQHTFLDHPMT